MKFAESLNRLGRAACVSTYTVQWRLTTLRNKESLLAFRAARRNTHVVLRASRRCMEIPDRYDCFRCDTFVVAQK